jgi:hypothetical protein
MIHNDTKKINKNQSHKNKRSRRIKEEVTKHVNPRFKINE